MGRKADKADLDLKRLRALQRLGPPGTPPPEPWPEPAPAKPGDPQPVAYDANRMKAIEAMTAGLGPPDINALRAAKRAEETRERDKEKDARRALNRIDLNGYWSIYA